MFLDKASDKIDEQASGYDFGFLDYIYPPKDEAELTQKYSALRRNLLGEDVTNGDKGAQSLRDYVQCARNSIKETREGLQNGTGLNIRFLLTPAISLLPLLVFRRRRPRKIFYTYALTSYFLCPEPWRAIYNAK